MLKIYNFKYWIMDYLDIINQNILIAKYSLQNSKFHFKILNCSLINFNTIWYANWIKKIMSVFKVI